LGRTGEPTDQLLVDGMQTMLSAHLLRNYTIDRWRPRAAMSEIDYRRLKRVLDLIETRFAEDISLNELAAEACLSPFYFARLFRKATGFSPHGYVSDRRIQEAKRELKLGRSSLLEIALETGFGSQANFIRVFRKACGVTPGQYRAMHRS
jgi:AraC family transcriptional regulator